MSYIQHEWKEHEPITPAKMNNIEEGVANLSLDATSGSEYENKENITGTINSSSNNINYPNTKAVYDYMQDKTRSTYHNDIRIDNPPNKIKYINGESFDLTGLIISCLEKTTCKQKVNNTVSDKIIGNSRITTAFPNSKITYSPSQAYISDMPKNQEQTLDYKITWTNHTSETHEVLTTNGQVTVTTYVADSIRLYDDSRLKKEYQQGENIDLTGLQLRSYDTNDNYISDISISSLTFSPTTAYVEDLDGDEKELTITVSYEEPFYHEILTYSFEIIIYNNKWVICSVKNLDNNNILNYINSSGTNGDTWLRGEEIEKVLANATYSISSKERNRIGKISFKNCREVKTSGFYSCSYLSFVKLSNYCTLGDDAFFYCKQLTSIEGTIISIGSRAFAFCSLLESLSLRMIGSIPNVAFYSCTNLQSIKEDLGITEECKIGQGAFQDCRKLSDLQLLTNFVEIGSSAFYGCSSLSSISFSNCKNIYTQAFYGCSQLKIVSFPECEYIGVQAFAECQSLENVIFPKCSIIDNYAFEFCYNLSTINLPECLSISAGAFYHCQNLKYIYLSKCSYIERRVFENCSIISLYLFAPSVCIIQSNTYVNTNISSIYVPASLVSDYKTAQYWSYYSSKITAIPT